MGSPASLPHQARLSPSQKAYRDDPDGFGERLLERAHSLFENHYRAYPADTPHLFVVSGEDSRGYFNYAVHYVDRTCTCAFYTRQVNGEYLGENLTDDQSIEPVILACKHWEGLPLLVKKTRRWLFDTEQHESFCALWVHWMKTLAHLRRERMNEERHQQHPRAAQAARERKQYHEDCDAS